MPAKRRWFQVHLSTAIVLMLGAMVIYVSTLDLAIGPGGKGQPVPAAP